MIRISFDPAKLESEDADWWEAWEERARDATQRAIERFEYWLAEDGGIPPLSIDFNQQIWSDLKNWFLQSVFAGKCAYCERGISGYYGDAEHYRPKGSVKRMMPDGKQVKARIEIHGPDNRLLFEGEHPGYFWLAYDWRNLIPACSFCNSGRGKNDRFDVKGSHFVLAPLSRDELSLVPVPERPIESIRWKGYYYLTPSMLDAREQPLLLNPLNPPPDRNPREHLRFGVRGIVAAVQDSPLGAACIEVFRLKDENLRKSRQAAQENFQRDYFLAMLEPGVVDNPTGSRATQIVESYRKGRLPFSAAALDFYDLLQKSEQSIYSRGKEAE